MSTNNPKYTLVRDRLEVCIHLDKLTQREITKGCTWVDDCDLTLSFSQEYAALPQQRRAALESSLADRTIHDQISELYKRTYQEIFENYCLAYRAGQEVVAGEVAKTPTITNLPKPLNPKGKRMPTVTVTCLPDPKPEVESLDAAAPAGALDAEQNESIDVPYIIIAPHSPVVERMNTAEMREKQENKIVLNWNVPQRTAQKIVDYMYDHEPLQIESDVEATAMYAIADCYEIETVRLQCAPRARNHMLTIGTPEHLISLEEFDRELSTKESLPEKALYYEETTRRVDRLYKACLAMILPKPPEAAAGVAEAAAAAAAAQAT